MTGHLKDNLFLLTALQGGLQVGVYLSTIYLSTLYIFETTVS